MGRWGKLFCSFTRSNTWPLIRHNAKNSKPVFQKEAIERKDVELTDYYFYLIYTITN